MLKEEYEQNYREALARIESCLVQKATSLNLSHLNLRSLPFELRLLKKLQKLDLSNNKIQDFSLLESLVCLRELNIKFNFATDLDFLKNLINLNRLDISHNFIRIKSETKLPNTLTHISCVNCLLKDISFISCLPNIKYLDCSYNKLSSLDDIGYNEFLTYLDCSYNELNSLSSLIYFPSLKKIHFDYNDVESFKSIPLMSSLDEMTISNNNINSLNGLSSLPNIKVLDVSFNKINDFFGMNSLCKLKTFSCHNNEIVNIREISSLRSLEILDCDNNYISDFSPLSELPILSELSCSKNKIDNCYFVSEMNSLTYLNLPYESKFNIPYSIYTDIRILRSYLVDIINSGKLEVNRGKILLLGNGRVGKSTLVAALKSQTNKVDSNLESTEGIALDNIEIETENSKVWNISVWDFGGQEIYHSTHRLFHSQDGIYLILWAEETDEAVDEMQHGLDYWIELVQENAERKNIIVVKNQVDRKNDIGLYHPIFQEGSNSNIPHVALSALKKKNITGLKDLLKNYLLEHMSDSQILPKSWEKVREFLDNKKVDSLSNSEFHKICAYNGVLDSQVLLDYFNNNGEVFYSKGLFNCRVFLNQNWVLEGVYNLYKKGEFGPREWIVNQQGKVTLSQAIGFFSQSGYSRKEAIVFINYMKKSKLAFLIDDTILNDCNNFKSPTLVIPGLLPKHIPGNTINEENSDISYKIYYSWLHRLAIERIIVEANHLAPAHTWWFNGISFKLPVDSCDCSIIANPNDKSITIHLRGEYDSIKNLLPIIISTIELNKVSTLIDEQVKISGYGWVKTDDIHLLHNISDYIKDIDGNIIEGMLYYHLFGLDVNRRLSNVSLNRSIVINMKNQYNVNNSPGAVVGENQKYISTQVVGNKIDKISIENLIEDIIDEIQELDIDNKDRCINSLTIAKDELNENDADVSVVRKYLKRASDLTKDIQLGLSVYGKIEDVLAQISSS
ncbi:Small GTP-binding protein [Vibrio chagasii]|nr:Small GTP-binding protein [Vibrio chagasii]CAH7068971.1 Small GTP-binding protein [Vibrio chagasii]CAH7085869.1 Small GTP-binding protein [Vibrio chagasii]CAH7138518.1 Small GTP-binding protein [Vibrio chagasii]CAH7316284.1 Small GTP-binding protein [Vibrio chagasii]